MTPSYFIWYRLEGEPAAARAAVTAMMLDIAADCGVVGRLLVRADDATTWMEIYEPVDDPAGFEAALARALARHAVGAHARDGRHVERFVERGARSDD